MIKPYYESGGITIYHGDCREVVPALGVERFDLVVADPPYAVSQDGGRGGFRGKRFVAEAWDVVSDYAAFSKEWMSVVGSSMKQAATMYVWAYHRSLPLLPVSTWYPLNLIIWRKTNAFPNTMQNSIWAPSCEYAYFLRKTKGKDHIFHIGKNDFARDYFEHKAIIKAHHPCEKPLTIIGEFVRRSTNTDSQVLDPFLGGGTTLVAARMHGRSAVGIELEERYCEVAAKRLAQECLF